ncbi:hypothetical protein J4474_02460 [Candidatus Pacearchaeota archaeon]|nr:hypothetical protein [Candidatus Pacearchaeota archaeon]
MIRQKISLLMKVLSYHFYANYPGEFVDREIPLELERFEWSRQTSEIQSNKERDSREIARRYAELGDEKRSEKYLSLSEWHKMLSKEHQVESEKYRKTAEEQRQRLKIDFVDFESFRG